MPTKLQTYAQMAGRAATQITASRLEWTAFLTTVGRLYKYPYNEQLMIHAQRPDATACAEFDYWNEKMRRYVRRGSRGIALIDTTGDTPRLRYVFDVSDTGSRENSRAVNLWQMKPEHTDTVTAMLERNYDISGENGLSDQLERVASKLADEYWNDHQYDILHIIDDSFLEEYDDININVQFHRAAAVSITYALMSRCGLYPEHFFEHEDFQSIFDFNTPAAVAALGTAVSEINRRVLRQIEVTIKQYEREKIAERSITYGEQPDLQPERGLSDSRSDALGADGDRPTESPDSGQIREDAERLFEGASPDIMEQPASVGEAVPAPAGDRRDGEPETLADDAGAGEIGGSDGEPESVRPGEMDGAYEQLQGAGGGNDIRGADLQLNPTTWEATRGEQLTFFPSESEQIAYIEQAESVSYTPFAFSFAREDIDQVLRLGGNNDNSRMRVAAEFMKQKTPDEIAVFLRNEYKGGSGFKTDTGELSAWYTEGGIHLSRGRAAQYAPGAQIVSWRDAAERIGELLEQGQFATNVELAEMENYVRSQLAQSLWYLRHDFNEPAIEQGYLPIMEESRGGGFPDETKKLAEALAQSEFRTIITEEYEQFLNAYHDDRDLLRFHYHRADELLNGLYELALPWREYSTNMTEPPTLEMFITEDEINAALTYGSSVEGGKGRIYGYFTETHTPKEQIAFLKKEYGIGGHSHALSGASHSDEWHDSKGIRLKKGNCPDIEMSWNTVAKRISELVRKGRYLTPEERAKYEEIQRETTEPEPFPTFETAASASYDSKQPADLEENENIISSERFTVVETDEGYAVWDGLHDGYYVDDEGVTEEFTSEWQANDYLKQVKKEVSDKENTSPEMTAETVAVYPAEENHLPYDIIVERLHTGEPEHDPPTIQPTAENFRITDDNLGIGGAKAKFQMNMDAISTLKQIELEGRSATPDEQEVLAKYVGWGGLADAFDENKPNWENEFKALYAALSTEEYSAARASTLNAHYTSPIVIKAIYEAVGNMGFTAGNILEPAMGVGNFFGLLPDNMSGSKLYGIELDSITGRIAKQLYPKADITVAGFETTDRRDFFDLAVGNVPFGQYKVNDRAYNKLGFSVHNYFFAKSIDQVRPGGVIAFVTSRYTLDKQSPEVRKYIAQRAELLGAVRLPNNAFRANAGTEVVSDIIFLQKRDRPVDIEPEWVHLGENEDGFAINSYFIDHPEMILGLQTSESTQYGRRDFTVAPIEGLELADQLHGAIKYIRGTYTKTELPELGEGEEIDASIPADPNVKNYSYAVVDGEVYFRENSRMVKPELNAAAKERVRGMVELRDCVHHLIDLQMWESDSLSIRGEQQRLNQLYDDFTAKHGLINSRGNALAFADDSSYYLLCSLEVLDEEGGLERKADMFTKRTIKQNTVVTSVDTSAEALALSIAEKAKVDLPYMAELTGFTEDKLVAELRGVIFRDFGGLVPEQISKASFDLNRYDYVTADEYLSGNVRERLRLVQYISDFLPEDQARELMPNIEALQAAQPKDLDASEIEVRLGATWIDKSCIRQFMYETFNPPYYLQRSIEVNFSEYTAEWNITGKSQVGFNDINANVTYGTTRANAYRILEDSLNLRDIRIYDTVTDPDGKERRVLNSKETTLAQQKQQAIKEVFRDWIWRDPERRRLLITKYNEIFNSCRPREYDGRHIVFSGMNPEISLREHQKNAVAHILYGGNTLLAHEVGAGKTFEMAAAAMESKRLGLCQKSLFAVPNHLTEQWASEFLRLYPSANILVATKKDFETRNRKKFCSRIATGDYDAVIIGHSQFERIPVSQERQERLLREQIQEIEDGLDELKASHAERFTIKQLERTKKSLETRLDKLHDSRRKDDVVTFEQLGVDRLFVDEAHNYKNCFLYTKMRNVAGLSTTDAQKSSDMLLKCRYIDELTGSRGVVFATGTPVSNSMTELYTMQRYLQHSTIKRQGLSHFDCWASTFGETQTAIELAPEGTGYRARTRFAKFFNLPELMTLFKEVADIKTADQLNLPTPIPVYHNVVAQPTEIQKELVQELSERAAAVHAGTVDASVDNMLKITSDGRKLGLDQRVINPDLPDEPRSKVNICVDNIAKIWRDGQTGKLTQLVFCDLSTPKAKPSQRAAEAAEHTINGTELHALEALLEKDGEAESERFTIYDDIRAKLIDRGIPPEQIAFIHDANTEVRKKELYAKVRSGNIRVLLGSTFKMGSGMNVQDRLVALHDLDAPWRPGDLEQRSGRIIRQGNMNKEVYIYRYVTEGTFDSYLWQTLENKQKFISQIMTSKSPVRSCEDIDATALSYAEIKALCAGDERIKEKMDLDIDVSRLRLMKASHQSQQYRLEDNLLKYFPEQIERSKSFIAGFEADMKTLSEHPHPKDGFIGMEVKGDMLTDKDNAGAAILEAFKDAKGLEPVPIGSYRGFAMSLTVEDFGSEYVLTLKGRMTHRVALGKDARGNLTRIDNALNQMPERLSNVQSQLENLNSQVEAAKTEVGRPFPQEDELRVKSARLAELNTALNIDDRMPLERQADETTTKSTRPSVLDKLKTLPAHGAPDKSYKKVMEAR